MGLFDRMLGRKSDAQRPQTEPAQTAQPAQAARPAAPPPDNTQRQEQLQRKYQPAITALSREQMQLKELRLQDNKLYIRALAPSQAAKDRVWEEIRRVDPSYHDITVDISVDPQVVGGGAATGSSQQTYIVKSGDTLSKLAKQFYGDPMAYMRIFSANRDQLSDPDKIQVGQKLVIPQ